MKKGNSKLTIDKVVKIKRLLKQGTTQKEIAEQFNVNPVTIGDIARGTTWKHVQIDEQGNLIKDEYDAEIEELVKYFQGLNKVDWNEKNIEKIKLLYEKLNISFSKMEELIGINRKQISKIVKADQPKVSRPPKKIKVMKDKPLPDPILKKVEVEQKETYEEGDIVESFQIVNEKEKRKFLDELWYSRPYRLDGVISTKIECSNEQFNTWLHSHWSKKYRPYRRLHMEEFLAQATWIVQDTVLRNQSLNWELINSNDDEETKKLYATLIQAITVEQMKYSNELQGVKVRERKVKGEKFYEYISLGDESIDILQSGADETEDYLANLLATDASIYPETDDNIYNDFVRFFHQYKNYFLTEKQLWAWHVMLVTNDEPTEREKYGMDRFQSSDFKKTIYKRAVQAYKEVHGKSIENPFEITMAKKRADNEIDLLKKFVELADRGAGLYELSMFIYKRIDKAAIEKVIVEELDKEETIELVSSYKKKVAMKGFVLYKLYDLFKAKIKLLEQTNFHAPEFYRKDEEYIIAGEVVSKEEYRKKYIQLNDSKRKKHTPLRLLASGSEFELNKIEKDDRNGK